VQTIDKDLDTRTITVVSQYDAPPERLWRLWADPRQLERWWGPPSHPATVTEHAFEPGGAVSYYMTGPDGERYGGWWKVVAVDPPTRLEFEDGFADAEGTPNLEMPVTNVVVTIEPLADGPTRMTVLSSYASREELEQVLEMGMLEGLAQAASQIDGLLAEG